MLSCGKTSDFLMCPECGCYHDGYPQNYTRPLHKTCTNCGHKGLGEGTVVRILLRLNKDIAKANAKSIAKAEIVKICDSLLNCEMIDSHNHNDNGLNDAFHSVLAAPLKKDVLRWKKEVERLLKLVEVL